jgi:hypothetical protein
MQKPTLSTEIIEEGSDRFSGHSNGQQDSAEKAATSGKKSRERQRFNPSAVGFSILDSPNNVDDSAKHTEPMSRVARRRAESVEEGK